MFTKTKMSPKLNVTQNYMSEKLNFTEREILNVQKNYK